MNVVDRFPAASAHGRFQPLHKGHLEYLLAAKQRCDFLWIGITQFDVSSLNPSPHDTHRQEPLNNPLTFFERLEMITNVMLDAGVEAGEFRIIPFPVDSPPSLTNFLPTSVPLFTTVYEVWNEYKVELLREVGYDVHILWRRDHKAYDGLSIRHLIRKGDPTWKDLVPSATIEIVEKYRIPDRLAALSKKMVE